MSNSCPLCINAERKTYEELIMTGEVSKTAVAVELDTTLDIIITHMDSHINSSEILDKGEEGKHTSVKRDLGEFKKDLDKRDVIINNIMILQEKMIRLADKDNLSTSEIKALVTVMSELRRSSTDLAQLTGELKKETVFTIQMFNSLEGLILSELCDECREKIMKSLSKIKNG